MQITVTVNGTAHTKDVEPRTLLVDFITLDGAPVKSCTVFAVQADGREVRTVEGLKGADGLHPVQKAFKEHHGLQCGFCTPGMMMVGCSLLEKNPEPTEDEVRWAISGNICRCTGYTNIVKSIQAAGAEIVEGSKSKELTS
jgi:carbon-monoxide dehydrogenase small subunit